MLVQPAPVYIDLLRQVTLPFQDFRRWWFAPALIACSITLNHRDKLSCIGEPYTYYHVEGGAKLT